MVKLLGKISTLSSKQKIGIQQIAKVEDRFSTKIQKNSTSLEEMSSSNEELASQAEVVKLDKSDFIQSVKVKHNETPVIPKAKSKKSIIDLDSYEKDNEFENF